MLAAHKARRLRKQRVLLGNRSINSWALRVLLALGTLIFGAVGVVSTLANVLLKSSPESAHLLAPPDGRVLGVLALQQFSAAPNSGANSEQARLAIRALKLDATAVEALNVLASQGEMRAEPASVDHLFGYSFALSRRELQPQIWAIEKAVERGDIARALYNYDLAFRTSRRAQQTLFPVLSAALAEPKVRTALLRLLAAKPVWTDAFLDYASAHGRTALAVAKLLREGEGRLPIEDAHRVRVVNGLVAQGFVEEAWDFYTTFRQGAARDRSRDPGFALQTDTPSTFDWTIGTAPGLSAAIVHGADASYLEFSTPPSTPAVVATQTQLLPPGTYRLVGTSAGLDQSETSRPYWVLRCRARSELGRVNMPNSAEEEGNFTGEFTVPSDCVTQTLALVLRASDKVSGVAGEILRVQLEPLDR